MRRVSLPDISNAEKEPNSSGLEIAAHVQNQYDTTQYIEWHDVESCIKVEPEWASTLDTTDGYSHLIFLWLMNKNPQKKKTRIPQGM
jgi:tRNA (Thr-GGU) A37 N-methylase